MTTAQTYLPGILTTDTINFDDVLSAMTPYDAIVFDNVLNRAADLIGLGTAEDDTPEGFVGERDRRYMRAMHRHGDRDYTAFYRITTDRAKALESMVARIADQYKNWEPNPDDLRRPRR